MNCVIRPGWKITLAGGLLIFLTGAWYIGVIPLFGGPQRASLRHALNLTFLPASVKIRATSTDSWTDYIFRADFDIHPEDFEKLLRARPYENVSHELPPAPSESIDDSKGFPVSEQWTFRHPKEGRPGDFSTSVWLQTNADRSRVFLLHASD